ncbi:MAG: TPM domain-containing protein [Defluviitaleaceae bacterium]|nr:TPM domain-containing protein [Defluviitaleaceae bacterium]
MKKISYFTWICLIFTLLFLPVVAHGSVPERAANYAVTDLAHLFSETTISYLVSQNEQLFESTGGEVVFLTVEQLPEGQSIREFSRTVFNAWGVGSVENNNGILIVIADLEGEAYITIGQGLEQHLSNNQLNHVLEQYFTPHFAVGDDDLGARQLFDVLSAEVTEAFPSGAGIVQQSPVTTAATQGENNLFGNRTLIIIVVIAFIFFLSFSRRRRRPMMMGGGMGFGRRRRGGFGSFAGGFLAGNLLSRRHANRNMRHQPPYRQPQSPTFTRSTPPKASTSRGAGVSVNRATRSQGRPARPSTPRSGSGGFSRGGSTRRGGR